MNKIYVTGDNRLPMEAFRELAKQGFHVIEMNSFRCDEDNQLAIEVLSLFDNQNEILEPIKPKSTRYTSSIGHFDKYLK